MGFEKTVAHLPIPLSTLKNFAFQVDESRILSVLEKASDEVGYAERLGLGDGEIAPARERFLVELTVQVPDGWRFPSSDVFEEIEAVESAAAE